ncbi:MAG: hypothetical protein WC809_05920 [Sinimarinibacterium sp.]|jgi:hypothetical protein
MLLFLFSTIARAEPFYITIPGEGWSLKVDAPPMTSVKGTSEGRIYQYMASSVETGLTLSLHTETEGGRSNQECRETYWRLAQRNPTLVKDTVTLSGSEQALFATHLSEGVYKGEAFKTANGHAYLAKNGLCIDLHASHWPYDVSSEKRVEEILRSVTIVQ